MDKPRYHTVDGETVLSGTFLKGMAVLKVKIKLYINEVAQNEYQE